MIKRIFVYGKVTDTFFRLFIRQNAKRLGINGFAKNVEDHVEAVFEGESSKVNEMIEVCKQGPPGAKVENVKVEDLSNYTGTFDDFEILR